MHAGFFHYPLFKGVAMENDQRKTNYLAYTGRKELTRKQRRRIRKKENRQVSGRKRK
jgi:hypothetical protein